MCMCLRPPDFVHQDVRLSTRLFSFLSSMVGRMNTVLKHQNKGRKQENDQRNSVSFISHSPWLSPSFPPDLSLIFVNTSLFSSLRSDWQTMQTSGEWSVWYDGAQTAAWWWCNGHRALCPNIHKYSPSCATVTHCWRLQTRPKSSQQLWLLLRKAHVAFLDPRACTSNRPLPQQRQRFLNNRHVPSSHKLTCQQAKRAESAHETCSTVRALRAPLKMMVTPVSSLFHSPLWYIRQKNRTQKIPFLCWEQLFKKRRRKLKKYSKFSHLPLSLLF